MELFRSWATHHVELVKEKPKKKIRTEQEITQTNRARFGRLLLLYYRNHESEENCVK